MSETNYVTRRWTCDWDKTQYPDSCSAHVDFLVEIDLGNRDHYPRYPYGSQEDPEGWEQIPFKGIYCPQHARDMKLIVEMETEQAKRKVRR